MVAAFAQRDIPVLRRLYVQGVKNGVPGLNIVTGEQARQMEPNLSSGVTAALLAPSAMIVSPWEYTLALIETAMLNGAALHLESEVTAIEKTDVGWRLVTPDFVLPAKNIINAAGVHADAVHNMALPPSFRIIPDRGEYYILDKSEGKHVSKVVFQCPVKYGKGTLVAPTVHGNLIVGPGNEKIVDAEDTATTAAGLALVAERAKKILPNINFKACIRNFAGVRAASDIDDFIINQPAPGFIDLAGIKSPGLSAAPAIARMAVDLLRESGLELSEKKGFTDTRKRVRFTDLSFDERVELARRNPAYGRIICRCETVTEGEILDAMNGRIPPRSVDAVKRRCNPGMGRCQGGFCSPKIVRLLAEHQGIAATEVLQDRAGSRILAGGIKEALRDAI